MVNCFTYLEEQSCTINLAHITFIEWDVPTKDELGRIVNRTTTVSLSGGGGFFLSERDSWVLRKAVQDYSKREYEVARDLHALNSISDALFWLHGFKNRSIKFEGNAAENPENQKNKEGKTTTSNNIVSTTGM